MSSTTQSVRKIIHKVIDRVATRAYLSTDQNNLTDTSWNKITLNALSYDLGGNFDITTNHRFTVPVPGLYKVIGKVHFTSGSVIANKTYGVAVYLNGALQRSAYAHIGTSTDEVTVEAQDELYLTQDDYLELYANPIVGASTVDVLSGEKYTSLIIRLITKEGTR